MRRPLLKNWDANFSIGGPIKRDRLWFFANTRTTGNFAETQNQYANKNVGNAALWSWAKDEGVRVRNDTSRLVNGGRLTSQVSPRNKVGFYADYTMNCSGSAVVKDSGQCRSPGDDWTAAGPGIGPGVATTSPESGTIWNAPLSIMQATWSSPISNRFLFESGYSDFRARWGDVMPEGASTDADPGHRAVHQRRRAVCQLSLPRLARPAVAGSEARRLARRRSRMCRAANNLKFGYQGGFMVAKTTTQVAQQLSYTFNNGAPISLSHARRSHARQRPHPLRRDLPPGCLDPRAPDPAGRAAFRDGVELGSGRRERRPRGAPVRPREHLPAHGRRHGLPRSRHRAAASSTTCSATARPRSRRTSESICRARSRARPIRSRTRRRRSSRASRAAWTDPNSDRIAQCDFLNPRGQPGVRAVVEPELGRVGRDDARESGRARGLGRAERRLAVRRRHPARDPSADVDRRELQPAFVEQLLHDAQRRADGRRLR